MAGWCKVCTPTTWTSRPAGWSWNLAGSRLNQQSTYRLCFASGLLDLATTVPCLQSNAPHGSNVNFKLGVSTDGPALALAMPMPEGDVAGPPVTRLLGVLSHERIRRNVRHVYAHASGRRLREAVGADVLLLAAAVHPRGGVR